MTRFKKEIRKRGAKLEIDYPFLPYNGIDCVIVHSEEASYSYFHYGMGWVRVMYDRALNASFKWED